MSKKKAFTGSTMTLKDFHGGSIPSDLPLPSAPGVVVRTPDRSALDRQIPATWGNPSNRSDHRSRPGSSNANRNFDDKASFLSHIGRNLDEDERKPLDSFSRRSVPDDDGEDRRRPVRMASNPRLETFSVLSQSNPATEILQGVTNGQISDGSVPNAWAARKELGIGFHQQEQSFKEETRNVSRFASALEKVSSGKWQSKLASATQQQQSGVDVLRFSDSENVNVQQNKTELIYAEGYQSYNLDHANARGDFHVVHHVDVRSDFDIPVRYGDGVRSKEEFLDYERARSPERNRGNHSLEYGNHGSQLNSDKLGGGLQSQLLTQVQERPKFQLVPRTRLLELSESHIMDQKQSYQLSSDPEKPGSAAVDGSNKAAERPKLNLKPRSQPFEQSDKIIIKARYKAGLEEMIILKKLVGADPDDKRHCVKFLSSFKYRNIGLKLTAVRAYAKQLFIALKHLRNCGVLHCDIKPDNMLVNEAKNVLKLCDFGNAMFAGKYESHFYHAPEIILGLPYDHPMDVWSVGCCLYELYLGKVLFPGPSNNEMLRLHMVFRYVDLVLPRRGCG